MSTFKRINGDYTIQSVNASDKILISSGSVIIEGNLLVSGNTQTYSTTDTMITDHTITLNAGATSPNPLGAYILVNRGSSANAMITWSETVGAWQISEVINGSYYTANIATTTTTDTLISHLSQDPTPTLSANLNIYNKSIYSNVNGVQLWSTTAPGGGGTGLTVSNSQYGNVELMNKTKSIVYSIIFG